MPLPAPKATLAREAADAVRGVRFVDYDDVVRELVPSCVSLNVDRELAAGVGGAERSERVGGLRELIRRLDGYAQRAVGEEAREALEVFGRRCGHDHRPPGTFAGGSGGRGDAAAFFGESGGHVRRVVDQVEDGVEAVGVAL